MGDIFYNKTVTVYNKAKAGLMGTETWYPTVLKNVRLLTGNGVKVSKSGTDNTDSAKLHVMLPPDGKKTYLPSKQWKQSSKKENFFTFTSGEDFFVEGDTTDEEPGEDFFSYMEEKYDNCYKVTGVEKYDLIPHLEVGGA